jgi:hypothetical protein
MKNFFENLYKSLYNKAYDAALEYHGTEEFPIGYYGILYYPTFNNFQLGYKAKVVYFKEVT